MLRPYERLLKYVTYDTQSMEDSDTFPSTKKQWDLLKELREELIAIGARNVELDENGYLYATVPASKGNEDKPVLAFLAHVDTAPDASGTNVRPRVIENYDGGDIRLNENTVTRVELFPELKKYVGKTLVVTDGTTLLGADDKAGVAEIMCMAERLINEPSIPHPEIRVIFSPDEEIGMGMAKINTEKVGASFAFTVDGGPCGEFNFETFNADAARVTINGVSVHPGYAYGIMKNASLIAMEFNALLPTREVPAATFSRYGFYHLTEMKGSVEKAELKYILRDHDPSKLNMRGEMVKKAAGYLNEKYGEGTVTVEISHTYRNMAEVLIPDHEDKLEMVREAHRELGIKLMELPVRGGTDGSALSFMGIPCPNLGTGGHACHGVNEFICAESMDQVTELLLHICGKFTDV